MSRAIAAVTASLSVLLGACFIIPPPITGDGCPWGGCRDDAVHARNPEPTLPPARDPFMQRSHYRAGLSNAYLSDGRLHYRSPSCEYEAVRGPEVGAPTPEAWRIPAAAIPQSFRVERAAAGCSAVRVGDWLVAVAVGQSREPGFGQTTGEQLWLGPAADGRRAQVLAGLR